MTITMRVAGMDDLAQWVSAATARGAARFELWLKLRGVEQERVLSATGDEPLEVADEFLSHVEGDRRVDTGQAIYAVFAYRDENKTPSERAFVAASPRSIATTHAAPLAHETPNGDHLHAAASAIAMTQQMIRDVFGSLQRENDHQRRSNETLVRATTGHFDALATGYESALTELRERHSELRAELATLRADHIALVAEHRALTEAHETQETVHADALAEQSRAHEVAMEKEKTENSNKKKAFAGFLTLSPLLLAYATKKNFGDFELLSGFLDSLTEQQTKTIMATLTMEQRAFLQVVIGEIKKAKKVAASAMGIPPEESASKAEMKSSAAPPTSPSNGSAPAASATTGTSAGPGKGATFVPLSKRVDTMSKQELDNVFREITELINTHKDKFNAWVEAMTREEAAAESAGASMAKASTPANDGQGGAPAS